MAFNFPIVKSVQSTDYVRVILNPGTPQTQDAQIAVADLLASASAEVAESQMAADIFTQPGGQLSKMEGFWSLDEMNGARWPSYPSPAGDTGSILREYNMLGLSPTVGNGPGIQGRALAAAFGLFPPGTYLAGEMPIIPNDRLAVNFHAKLTASVIEEGFSVAVLTIAPRQTSRRPTAGVLPGNFLSVGVELINGNFRFSAYVGYIFPDGSYYGDKVISGVNLSDDTYYQVLVYASSIYSDTVGSTRKLGISVDNNLTEATRTAFLNPGARPVMTINDNPILGNGHQAQATGLNIDNLMMWYNHEFTAKQREILYNGQAGLDPWLSTIKKCLAFWDMDEVNGTRIDIHSGRYNLIEPSLQVGSAAGQYGLAANFAGAATSYLATRRPELASIGGVAVSGMVRLDVVGAGRPIQTIVGWFVTESTIVRGFRLHYNSATGFVFEVGDGTTTKKTVAQNPGGGVLALTWYQIHAGTEPDGTLWISVNNATRTLGATKGMVASHNEELYLGRDHDDAGFPALDGQIDVFGVYSPHLTTGDETLLAAVPFYPHR